MMNKKTAMLKLAKLLSIEETAQLLGISRATLYRWMKDEAMFFPEPVHLDNFVGFNEADVRKWMKIIQG